MKLGYHEEIMWCSLNLWRFEPAWRSHPELPPHHGNQTFCSLPVERSHSSAPASTLYLHRGLNEGGSFGLLCLLWEYTQELVCLRLLPAAPEQSFLNWALHHVWQPIGKVSSVPNYGFCPYKPCLFVLSRGQFGLQPESASVGL